MELKSQEILALRSSAKVLIVPLWNWNFEVGIHDEEDEGF